MKAWKGLAICIGVILLIGLAASLFTSSKYQKDNAAYELLVERLRRDSLASAEIISRSIHKEDSLLEKTDLLHKKIYRYKIQKDELEDKIIDYMRHDYSSVPDSLKQHTLDSLLSRLEDVQARFDNSLKNN